MRLSCALARFPILLLLLFAVTVSSSGTIPCIIVLPLPLRISPHGRSMLWKLLPAVPVAFSDYDRSWCSFPPRMFIWEQQPAVSATTNQSPEVLSNPDVPRTSPPIVSRTLNSIVDESIGKPSLSTSTWAPSPVIPTAASSHSTTGTTEKSNVADEYTPQGLSASIWATAPDLPAPAPRDERAPSRPAFAVRSPKPPRRGLETRASAPVHIP
ncbi:hypothetical protein FB451DRAFT_1168700 [Mycena latifolia]|nr:hypothetical protein FB451DRAFT_1168700 [Mycena latifolia]